MPSGDFAVPTPVNVPQSPQEWQRYLGLGSRKMQEPSGVQPQ